MPRHALFLWTVGGIAGSTSTSTSDATGATSLLWLRNRLSTDGTDDASSWTECKWTAIVTSYMRQPDGGVGASSVSASATAQVQPSTKKRAKLAATRQQQQVPPPFFSVMTERRSAVDEQMMMASGGGPSTHIIGSGSGVTRDMFMLYPRHQSGSDKIIKNVVDARTYAVIQTDPHLEALLPGTKFKQLQRRHVLRVEVGCGHCVCVCVCNSVFAATITRVNLQTI